jgi:hypothetical protein
VTPEDSIQAARDLAPLLREKAREAEIARRPLDEAIEAARKSGLFSMMVRSATAATRSTSTPSSKRYSETIVVAASVAVLDGHAHQRSGDEQLGNRP